MDRLSFWASVIASLASMTASFAWPLAAVVIVAILRPGLLKLILSLRRFRLGEKFEAFFGEHMERAEQTLEAAPSTRQLQESKAAPSSTGPTFEAYAALPARPAILEAWWLFENTASRIYRDEGLVEPGRPAQFNEMIDRLRKVGVLDDGEAAATKHLRDIRNKVVHATSAEAAAIELPQEKVAEYVGALRKITEAMETRAAARKKA
jgi:hypothetical protein